MKLLNVKKQFLWGLLAVLFFSGGDANATGIEDYRRSILAARVERVVDVRENALLECSPNSTEAVDEAEIRRLRGEYKSYAISGTPGLLSLMEAYGITSKIKRSKSPCGEKISAADYALFEGDRRKFEKVRTLAWFFSLSPNRIPPSEYIFIDLDPWCASDVQANFNGARDTNPCFAGEAPILDSLRDAENTDGTTYFTSAMEVDQFLARLSEAVASGSSRVDLETLFTGDTDHRRILGIFAYLYSAGTSELGWVDGFGESFWRSTLDQGSSPQAALAEYVSWLERKDRFVILKKQFHAKNGMLRLLGREVGTWNHHEFISAFLACNYRTRGQVLLSRTVPEALGVVYEGKDFVSHLREDLGVRASAKNFVTDVTRHEVGGRFGRLACTP